MSEEPEAAPEVAFQAKPVQATPENFGMLFAAVMHIQGVLGEQLATEKNSKETKTEEHLAAMETIKILSKTNALVRYGSYLMVTLAGGMMYLLLEIHRLEVLIAGLKR